MGISFLSSGGEGGSVEDPTQLSPTVLPTVRIDDGNFVAARFRVPADKTLDVYVIGVQNDSNNAPAGLVAQVYDETNNSVITSTNAEYTASSSGIASESGAIDASLRIDNSTGDREYASAVFIVTIT